MSLGKSIYHRVFDGVILSKRPDEQIIQVYDIRTKECKEVDLSFLDIRNFLDFAMYDKNNILVYCHTNDGDRGIYFVEYSSLLNKKLLSINGGNYISRLSGYLPILQVVDNKIFVYDGLNIHCIEVGNFKDKVIGINVDNAKSLARVGEIVSIYSPLINPFTLQSSGPDKTRLKGRAIIESIDKNYVEIRITYITNTQILSGDIVVAGKSENVVIGEVR